MLPNSFHLALYRLLKALDYWAPQQHPLVKFLPFGLCLKNGSRVSENKASALHLIEKHTSITAVRLINFTLDRKAKKGLGHEEKPPGVPVTDHRTDDQGKRPYTPKEDFLDDLTEGLKDIT
ncbi:hypothetical protein FQN55_003237 [Onygenales sp. PD_40]|nr:hypothetical protein FQN55_003237 [Onygenales sp. PD_40]KAK2769475.1 hypothetical protein FQN53_006161 [Emmonsiellopsis sp. PD_33]KAK2794522.1 hypothetical protein FQN52_008100 [Onygenales sp. PD_12]KAK2799963.1 hypothetical protein FQN51_006392 [Onygenales sp. PD_10]